MTREKAEELVEMMASMSDEQVAQVEDYVHRLKADEYEDVVPCSKEVIQQVCKQCGVQYDDILTDVQYDPNASAAESLAQWKAGLGNVDPEEWDRGVDDFIASLRPKEYYEPQIDF